MLTLHRAPPADPGWQAGTRPAARCTFMQAGVRGADVGDSDLWAEGGPDGKRQRLRPLYEVLELMRGPVFPMARQLCTVLAADCAREIFKIVPGHYAERVTEATEWKGVSNVGPHFWHNYKGKTQKTSYTVLWPQSQVQVGIDQHDNAPSRPATKDVLRGREGVLGTLSRWIAEREKDGRADLVSAMRQHAVFRLLAVRAADVGALVDSSPDVCSLPDLLRRLSGNRRPLAAVSHLVEALWNAEDVPLYVIEAGRPVPMPEDFLVREGVEAADERWAYVDNRRMPDGSINPCVTDGSEPETKRVRLPAVAQVCELRGRSGVIARLQEWGDEAIRRGLTDPAGAMAQDGLLARLAVGAGAAATLSGESSRERLDVAAPAAVVSIAATRVGSRPQTRDEKEAAEQNAIAAIRLPQRTQQGQVCWTAPQTCVAFLDAFEGLQRAGMKQDAALNEIARAWSTEGNSLKGSSLKKRRTECSRSDPRQGEQRAA